MKKTLKTICIIVSVLVAISLLTALIIYLIPERISISLNIIGEDETVLYEKNDIKVVSWGNSPLMLYNAVVQVLNKNNIDYVLDENNEMIVKMFDLEEYVNDGVYADSGAYWKMYVNSEPINDRPSEVEIKDGDCISLKWCLYDRHEYCDHD